LLRPFFSPSRILHNESIHCGFHLIPHIVQTVLTTLPSSVYAIITDTNVGPLFLPSLQSTFESQIAKAGVKSRVLTYKVQPGEEAKSREVKAELEDWLLESKCTRDTVVLALGGGVIGDLTGFVAATL
jgi:pentafunctional AROM polypeptide